MGYYMGCGSQINESQLETYEKTGHYVAEPKCDGQWSICRSAFRVQKFHSRYMKPQAFGVDFPRLPEGTWIVGELGIGQQEAVKRQKEIGHEFMDVFDVLRIEGKDVTQWDDNDRRRVLFDVWDKWPQELQEWFRLVPRWDSRFRKHFKEQDEGLVLKRVGDRTAHFYVCDSLNPHWIKVKREITVDMVVMDYELSNASSFVKPAAKRLICGVYKDGKLQLMTRVGNMTAEMRYDIAANFYKYKGRVIEIVCNKVFESGAVRHPRFKCFRDDKMPEDCTWEALKKLMEV